MNEVHENYLHRLVSLYFHFLKKQEILPILSKITSKEANLSGRCRGKAHSRTTGILV